MRLDQWLWAVRVYKTRSQAAAAVRSGDVSIGGAIAKAGREVHPEEIVIAKVHERTRTVRVVGTPLSRVGAKLVPQFMEDLTPPEEYARRPEESLLPPGFRPGGSGRPTKRDRRDIDQFTEPET